MYIIYIHIIICVVSTCIDWTSNISTGPFANQHNASESARHTALQNVQIPRAVGFHALFGVPNGSPFLGPQKVPRFILVKILCSYYVHTCSMMFNVFGFKFILYTFFLRAHFASNSSTKCRSRRCTKCIKPWPAREQKKRWIGSQTNSTERPNLLKSRKTSLLLEEPTATCPWTHHPGHSWHFAPLEIAQAFAPKASCESEHPTWIKADISRTEIYKSVHQRV